MIGTNCFCILLSKRIQPVAIVLSAAGFIHADVIDIKIPVLYHIGIVQILDLTHRIALNRSCFIFQYKDRSVFIRYHG